MSSATQESDDRTQYQQRAKKFSILKENKPDPGTILRAKDGGVVPVFVDKKKDNRVVFCNAAIDDDCTGWYLTKDQNGLKCLILPRSQEVVLKTNPPVVSELRVVRLSDNRRSLICEVV